MSSVERTGWGVAISGHQFDLEDVAKMFPGSTAPSAQWHTHNNQRMLVLTAPELTTLGSSGEVRKASRDLLQEVNGLLACREGSGHIALDCVVEFKSDGSLRRHIFADIKEGLSIRTRFSATATLTRDGDTQVEERVEPAETPTARHLRIARANPALHSAIKHLADAKNLRDLYVVHEALSKAAEQACGEKREALKRIGWISTSDQQRFKQSANVTRHSEYGAAPHASPMDFHEAKRVVAKAIGRAVEYFDQ